MTDRSLSPKQARFVDEYLIDLNATQAAIRAGFAKSTAEKKAPLWVGKSRESCPENMRHVWDAVADAIQARSERTQIKADDVLLQLVRMGMSDVRKLFTPQGQLKAIHELDDDTAAAIQSIEVVTRHIPMSGDEPAEVEYVHKIRFTDKIKPLELIGKHMGKALGQWAEKLEHGGRNGGPVETVTRIELVAAMSPEEASKTYYEMLKQ